MHSYQQLNLKNKINEQTQNRNRLIDTKTYLIQSPIQMGGGGGKCEKGEGIRKYKLVGTE